jgi:methylglyoxal synthase
MWKTRVCCENFFSAVKVSSKTPVPFAEGNTYDIYKKLHHMISSRRLNLRKRIALVAHDNKKKDLIDWAEQNRAELARHELLATGTTGKMMEDKLDRTVKKLLSGPLGGDQQIGALIAAGEIDLLVFFWDPMEAQPHDSDVKALLRVAIAWNCIVACDRATADFVLTSPLMQQEYLVDIPDYSSYLKRRIE